MNRNYGVLRVVRVRSPANVATELQDKYPAGWIPEEHLVHLLTQRDTTIGRALNNDIVLIDPTVSREHARLVLDASGWYIINLTARNVVRINGQDVPSGQSLLMQPQDVLVLGSTMLQLVAPQSLPPTGVSSSRRGDEAANVLPVVQQSEPGNYPQPVPQDITSQEGIIPIQQADSDTAHIVVPLPDQPDPELEAQPWDDEEEESLLGAGVTMRFALPQRLGMRTRWFIAGIGVAILCISAMITLVLNSLVGLTALAQYGMSNVVFAFTFPIIPALGIGLLVNFMDRFEREPWFLRLAAFLWGAIIAIPPALFIEQNVDGALQNFLGSNASDMLRTALQGLNVGITEETVKGLGLLLLFLILRDEFDNVTDGLIYGALIGAGFAMMENFVYFAHDSQQSLVFLIVMRVILGWLGHSTFTMCFGAALGYIRHTRVQWRQIMIPVLGYLVAIVLHSFFDFVNFQASAMVQAAPGNNRIASLSLTAIICNYIPPFVAQMFLLYILIKALVHEAAVIREFLTGEVRNGIVRVDEYALLQSSFQRTKSERRVLRKHGIRQWLRVKALYQTEIGLAFRKWHVSMGDKPKLGYIQPEDAYRQRIRRLRHQILAAGKNTLVR